MAKQYNIFCKTRQYLEAKLFNAFLHLTNRLSLKTSSIFCGKVATLISKFLHNSNQIALYNLRVAFPEKSTQEHKHILAATWKNIGYFVGEFNKVNCTLSDAEIRQLIQFDPEAQTNFDYLIKAARSSGTIVASAHLGNWEVGARLMKTYDLPLNMISRQLNNQYMQKIAFQIHSNYNLIDKGKSGAREIVRALNHQETILIMMDQYLRTGIEIPFFQRPTKTADAIAQLAINYQIPIVPFYALRNPKSESINFIGIVKNPIVPRVTKTNSVEERIQEKKRMLIELNHTLEEVIREYPDQWFWLHNRWKINL